MKWLAIALVLANVAFFGWSYELRLRAAPTAPAPLPATTPSLRLLSELDELPPLRVAETPLTAAPEPPTIAARPVAGGAVASDHCVEIGPFPATKDADTIERWLTSRATAVQRIVQVVRKRKLLWVYLEPKNADEAQAEVARLEHKGIHDYLLVQRGGLQHAISLGLFTTQEAVNRRLSEMGKQGFQPVVVPRIAVTKYAWLRANLAVGYPDTNTLPREQLAGAAVQTIDCAKIADLTFSP